MKKPKGKPVKWHVSYGPKNPRVNLKRLDVVNYVFAQKEIDEQIITRIKSDKLRNTSIIIADADFNMMIIDIRKKVSSKPLKYAGIFLYGNGIVVAEFIDSKTKKFRDDLAAKAPDKEEPLMNEGETQEEFKSRIEHELLTKNVKKD